MPAKLTANIVISETVESHLRTVYARAMLEGVTLTPRGSQRISRSALARQAIAYGAEASAAALRPSVPALPERAVATDTERLKAAMAREGLTNATLGALLGVSRDVVKNAVRGLPMGPALRAWLADNGGVE